MRTTPRRRWRSAATYDPYVLRALKVYGFKADPDMARVWYEKARELGSAAAPRRLEMLTRGCAEPTTNVSLSMRGVCSCTDVLILFIITIALASSSRIDAANAQVIPKSLQEGGSDAAIKQRKNAWTVGVAGGLIDGTYMRFADELGKVLDDGDNLRILPMVSYGAASNLDDLIYLRGVDLAVTQSDVFEYFRTERKTPNLQTGFNTFCVFQLRNCTS